MYAIRSYYAGQIEVPVFFALLQPRKMTAWAKVESWDNWFLNWVFNLWGIIPVRRGEADTSALRKAMEALDNGYFFGIAPEGHRNKNGRLRRVITSYSIHYTKLYDVRRIAHGS